MIPLDLSMLDYIYYIGGIPSSICILEGEEILKEGYQIV